MDKEEVKIKTPLPSSGTPLTALPPYATLTLLTRKRRIL
jgi:hypothetical protein